MKTDDKLIAEFMGFNKNVFESEFYVLPSPYNSDGPFCSCEFLRFANCWDWLMPVVEKIEHEGHEIDIYKNACEIDMEEGMIREVAGSKIEATHNAVVEFIKWYNQQPK